MLQNSRIGLHPAVSLLAIAFACAPASHSLAAVRTPETPQLPIERATVELILINVHVADLQDQPITDLTIDDFTLRIDGHPAPIASFDMHRLDARTGPDGSGRAFAGDMTGALHPRRFVLFFDETTSARHGITAAWRAVERFVGEGLDPSDEVSLISYDGRLALVHDFSRDRAHLLDAARRWQRQPPRVNLEFERRFRDAEIRRALEDTMNRPRSRARLAAHLARSYASEERRHMQGIIEALTAVADTLSAWPGYKAIVFMGDGLPQNPAWEPFVILSGASSSPRARSVIRSFTPEIQTRIFDQNMSLEHKKLLNDLSATGIAIHSLQTGGLGIGRPGVERAASQRGEWLRTLARETGGTAYTLNAPLDGLRQAERFSRVYYILGYSPEGEPDGRSHSVQVAVAHPESRATWRRNFVRLPPEVARGRSIQAAHVLPEYHNELGVSLRLIPGSSTDSGQEIDAVIHLPPGSILYLPESRHRVARLEVGLVGSDATGRSTLRLNRALRIKVPETDRALSGFGLNLYTRFTVGERAQSITAVVHDGATGSLGAAKSELPSRKDRGGLPGLSLYSLDEESLWVEVTAEDGARTKPPAFGPSLKESFKSDERVSLGFRVDGPSSAAGPIRVEFLREGRLVRSLMLRAGAGAGDDAPGHVRVPLEGLETGPYRMRVVVDTVEEGPEGTLFIRLQGGSEGAG